MADSTDKITPPPGTILAPTMSPIYVDGLSLPNALAATQARTQPGQQGAFDQRFWASPPRRLNDLTDETIYVTLAKPKLINYISLDLPHFPHHFYLHWWDTKTKQWLPLQGDNGFSIRIYIDGSVPKVIGPATVLQAHQHPSHYGADHWIHYDMDIKPVTTSKLRFSGLRAFGSKEGGPVDVHGKDAPYSLGIRNLDFGYRVRKKSDIPLTDRKPDIVTERESFTTVTDMLGSSVDLSMRENRASDLLQGRQWKCEPQPFSYAVVNLYVDARDAAGNPQTVDRFYLDPVTSGVNVSVYHSEDAPTPDHFTASDAPLSFPLSRAAGQIDPSIDGEGLLFPDKISYLDLDNQAIQWDSTRPWWMAINIQPQFDSQYTGDHVIWDAGAFQLMWTAGQWTLVYGDGALLLPSGDFSYNQRIQLVVAYDGAQIYLYYAGLWAASAPASFKNLSVETLRFGAELGDSAETSIINGAYRLNSLVLKQEPISFTSDDFAGLIVPDSVRAFIDDPIGYVQKSQFEADGNHSTDNAILRFATNFRLGDKDGLNPWGFVGGPGDIYADVTWTPVARDYKLARGFMQLNPTRASVFKFEFTNLQPQPYEVYSPTTTKVQVFPTSVVKNSLPATPSGPSNVTSSGLQSNYNASHPYTYADAIRLLYAQQSQTGIAGTPPTEALVATDPATAARLQNFGSLYNFHPWQPPAVAPSFPTVCQHYYDTVEIVHSSRVAYFVALSGLRMYRVDYATDDDTEIYLETFADTQHLDDNLLIPQNVQTTLNRVLNPSFELDANVDGMPDSYTLLSQGTVTGGTVAQSSEQALFGSYSLKVDGTLGSTGTDRLGVSFFPTGLNMANSVAASIHVKVTQGHPIVRVTVEYYSATNTFISSANSTLTNVGATWQRLEGVFTPPSNADHIKVLYWAEGGGGPVTVYFDGAQVEESLVSDYCDGDQPGCEWLGTAHNSASGRVGISTSPWKHDQYGLTTPVNLSEPAVASSVVLPSKRKVRGIQFATQETAPVQLLIDPDFDDPELRAWSKLGDTAPLELSADFNASIGSTVKVTREAGLGTWDSLETEWGSWDELEASGVTEEGPVWNDMEGTASGSAAYGGLRYTATVETTQAGRIYAAARVYSDAALTEPLILQLIDQSGDVLAEAEQQVTSGHISEWYVGYTIGSVGTEVITTWNDIENRDPSASLPTWNDLEIYTWDTVDTTIEPAGTRVSAQLIQRGETDDTWYVDNLSVFENAIVWEFSNDGGTNWWPAFDIKNNPHGVLIFPDPTTPTPSTGTGLMWRVTGYRPNLHVNSLAIRPWYGSLPLGVPHTEPGMGGPNTQPTDHYAPVEQDPRWKTWSDPIPQDWYFVYRQLLALTRPYVPVDTSTPSKKADLWLNPHVLVPLEPPQLPVEGPPTPPVGPEVYVDIYGDPYPETYGPEAGGDTFTDNYGNSTY